MRHAGRRLHHERERHRRHADNITTEIDSEQNLTSNGDASSLNVVAIGGRGGHGGNAASPFPYTDRNRGGNGKPDQNGGTLNVMAGADTSGTSYVGPDGAAVSGITIISGGGVPTEQEGSAGAGVSALGTGGQGVTATIGGEWTSTPAPALCRVDRWHGRRGQEHQHHPHQVRHGWLTGWHRRGD